MAMKQLKPPRSDHTEERIEIEAQPQGYLWGAPVDGRRESSTNA